MSEQSTEKNKTLIEKMVASDAFEDMDEEEKAEAAGRLSAVQLKLLNTNKQLRAAMELVTTATEMASEGEIQFSSEEARDKFVEAMEEFEQEMEKYRGDEE